MGIGRIARRTVLGLGVLTIGGLAVGWWQLRRPWPNPLEAGLEPGDVVFNDYVKVAADGTVTIVAPRAEMGQGIHTTLATLVCEELDLDPATVTVIHGPPADAYYNAAMLGMGGPFPWFDEGFQARAMRSATGAISRALGLQATGGSSSTIDGYEKMRVAGAAARMLLTEAAARRWGVPASGLRTEAGAVIRADGTRLSYGELAVEAAALSPPDEVPLRPASAWQRLGRPVERVDLRAKVTGAPIFGIDVSLPGMLYGTVKMSPRLGARPQRHDETAARAVAGVIDIVPIETTVGTGFGILAENSWAAFRGREALEVSWGPAPYPADEAGLEAAWRAALAAEPGFTMGGTGDADAALAAPDARVIEAEYAVPFLAHATMEPMNATARFADGRLEIWTGTQMPGLDRILAARLLGIDSEAVTIHVSHLGGGFGRRGIDPALYAAALAKAAGGRPVKVTWTREEDTAHDFYRPRALGRLRAALAPDGTVAALAADVAAPSVLAGVLTRSFTELPVPPQDDSILDGLFNQPYDFPASRFAAHPVDVPIPVGFWRSVGNSVNGFLLQSFLDEIAVAAGRDPFDLRLAHMTAPEHAPARAVLAKLREVSGWGGPLPAGAGRGMAFHLSFGTWVGQVIEVAASGDGLRVTRAWCVADPGRALDPRLFSQQMVSGLVMGLSAAIGEAVTFADGMAQETNFDTYPLLGLAGCPAVEVHILETAPKLGGAGEPGTPPAAPALANAIFAATGRRLRSLPLGSQIAFV
jgi:isoquinoline 1-oxidoreductase beta subunit